MRCERGSAGKILPDNSPIDQIGWGVGYGHGQFGVSAGALANFS